MPDCPKDLYIEDIDLNVSPNGRKGNSDCGGVAGIGILRSVSVKDEDADHVNSSVEFINEMKMDKRINEIILHHHDSLSELDFFGKILKKSDRDSGEEEKETKEEQLVSIFSKIRITEENKPKEYYLPLKILDSNDFNDPSLEKRK